MYKIYINETPLVLASSSKGSPEKSEEQAVARYSGKTKHLLGYIDMLEKSQRWQGIWLYHPDVEQLWEDFKSLFKWIEAAGGVVTNPDHAILFIFRRDFWDLPKGKIDEGESPEEAAVREVREETGLDQLQLSEKVGCSYHTYREKNGQRVLKKTHWFHLQSPHQSLTPQTEEDIDLAIWLPIETFRSEERVVYRSISDVLDMFLSRNQ